MVLLHLVLALALLVCGGSTAGSSPSSDDALLTSGTVPTDTAGNPVSAHEGWLTTRGPNDFLWYGAGPKRNASSGTGAWDWVSDSVQLYTSPDLTSWHRRGAVFSAASLPQVVVQRVRGSNNADAPLRLERPKVLYNQQRRYYVLLLHLDNLERSRGEVAWAVSVSPYGPFKFEASRQPSGLPSQDITVASERDTTAWLAHAVPNAGIAISQLTSDFLDTSGACAHIPAAAAADSTQQQRPHALRPAWNMVARLLTGPLPGMLRGFSALARGLAQHAAAPCLFRFKHTWFLLAVQQPGWQPSLPLLFANDDTPCNATAWRQLPSPMHAAAGAAPALYNSRPAFVFRYAFDDSDDSDQVLLLYFGDRYARPAAPGASELNASFVYLPLLPAAGGGLRLASVPSFRPRDYQPAPSVQGLAAVVE